MALIHNVIGTVGGMHILITVLFPIAAVALFLLGA